MLKLVCFSISVLGLFVQCVQICVVSPSECVFMCMYNSPLTCVCAFVCVFARSTAPGSTELPSPASPGYLFSLLFYYLSPSTYLQPITSSCSAYNVFTLRFFLLLKPCHANGELGIQGSHWFFRCICKVPSSSRLPLINS